MFYKLLLIIMLVSTTAHAQTGVKIGVSFATAPSYATIKNGELETELPMPDEERALFYSCCEQEAPQPPSRSGTDHVPCDGEQTYCDEALGEEDQ